MEEDIDLLDPGSGSDVDEVAEKESLERYGIDRIDILPGFASQNEFGWTIGKCTFFDPQKEQNFTVTVATWFLSPRMYARDEFRPDNNPFNKSETREEYHSRIKDNFSSLPHLFSKSDVICLQGMGCFDYRDFIDKYSDIENPVRKEFREIIKKYPKWKYLIAKQSNLAEQDPLVLLYNSDILVPMIGEKSNKYFVSCEIWDEVPTVDEIEKIYNNRSGKCLIIVQHNMEHYLYVVSKYGEVNYIQLNSEVNKYPDLLSELSCIPKVKKEDIPSPVEITDTSYPHIFNLISQKHHLLVYKNICLDERGKYSIYKGHVWSFYIPGCNQSQSIQIANINSLYVEGCENFLENCFIKGQDEIPIIVAGNVPMRINRNEFSRNFLGPLCKEKFPTAIKMQHTNYPGAGVTPVSPHDSKTGTAFLVHLPEGLSAIFKVQEIVRFKKNPENQETCIAQKVTFQNYLPDYIITPKEVHSLQKESFLPGHNPLQQKFFLPDHIITAEDVRSLELDYKNFVFGKVLFMYYASSAITSTMQEDIKNKFLKSSMCDKPKLLAQLFLFVYWQANQKDFNNTETNALQKLQDILKQNISNSNYPFFLLCKNTLPMTDVMDSPKKYVSKALEYLLKEYLADENIKKIFLSEIQREVNYNKDEANKILGFLKEQTQIDIILNGSEPSSPRIISIGNNLNSIWNPGSLPLPPSPQNNNEVHDINEKTYRIM